MKYSIVNFIQTQALTSFRLDAEYYHPHILIYEQKINALNGKTVKAHGCQVVSGPFGSSLTSEAYLKKGIPFIRISDLDNFIVNSDNLIYISKENHIRLSSSKLNIGDLVLSKVGNTIGVVSKITEDIGECNISENNIGIRFSNLTDTETKDYILAFLSCRIGQIGIHRLISGNAQPKLNVTDIDNILIPESSKHFKNVISQIINLSIQRNNESKNMYFQAERLPLTELGLLDWEPKHQIFFVKNYSDAQTAERIDAEYFQPKYDDIIAKIQLMENKTLGDFITIKKSVEPGSDAYQDEGIPFLRVSNLTKHGIDNGNQQYISEKLYSELSDYQPRKGEILLSKDATPGIALYLKNEPPKMIPSGGIVRLLVKDKQILPEYITLILNSAIVQEQIERDAGGSIINHWLVDDIRKTIIPVLDMQKQEKIAETVNKSFYEREKSKQLLEIAKNGVEKAIEQDETIATKCINTELSKIGIKI